MERNSISRGRLRLPDFIARIGDAEAARRWGISRRTAASWRLGERLPRAHHAQRIVADCDGLVDWESIYNPDFVSDDSLVAAGRYRVIRPAERTASIAGDLHVSPSADA